MKKRFVHGASTPAGSWSGWLDLPYGQIGVSLQLRQDEDGWRGQLRIPLEGVEGELSSLTLRRGRMSLELVFETIIIRGAISVDGDTLYGLLEFPVDREGFVLALGRQGSVVARDLAEDVQQSRLDTHKARLRQVSAEELRLPPPPPDSTVDGAALERLLAEAEATHSDAIVILKDGGLVGAWYAGGEIERCESNSVTKSIVNLAIGRLVTLGKLEGLDQPVHRFFRKWRRGAKRQITLRHLLAHTSGLEAHSSTERIYASPDSVRLALATDLIGNPGDEFLYNNNAVNLLPEIVARAAGKRMDLLLKDDLFAELGIEDFEWELDHAGHPYGMAGFEVYPHDLARLGQLVLERGKYRGRTLIAPSWLDESLRAGSPHEPTCGLLWWLIPGPTYVVDDDRIDVLRTAGASERTLEKVEEHVKGSYSSVEEYEDKLGKVFGGDWREVIESQGERLFRKDIGRIVGYSARGELGQYLVIFPSQQVVAVRMFRMWPGYDSESDGFLRFAVLVWKLSDRT